LFYKCDLRVGKIESCIPHPESEKLYISQINLGDKEPENRQILSGLQHHVTVEEMMKRQVIVFGNLKPRKLAGIPSNGMVLVAQ